MRSSEYIFLLGLFLSTTVASDCPTGCSCRGQSVSEWHTAICYRRKGPTKDFPSSIKTLEVRHIPFSSMRQYFKHAPDVTDLIIHDTRPGKAAGAIPVDLFEGMKHLKALTFHKFRRGVLPLGLVASLENTNHLKFLDLSRNRLECSCELPHWIKQHRVILLSLHSLAPSTACLKAGFAKDVYKATELFDICGKGEGNVKITSNCNDVLTQTETTTTEAATSATQPRDYGTSQSPVTQTHVTSPTSGRDWMKTDEEEPINHAGSQETRSLSKTAVKSAIFQNAVDVKLHPLDPFEMRLLLEYLDHNTRKHTKL